MFLGVLTGLLLEIFVEDFDATRKSRSVVFLAERLENKLGFSTLVPQLKPLVFLVAFRSNAGSFVWSRWIEDRIDKHFASFLTEP